MKRTKEQAERFAIENGRYYHLPDVYDPYTAVYLVKEIDGGGRPYYGYRGMSEDPFFPLGFSTYGDTPNCPIDEQSSVPAEGECHETLGKRVNFFDLPERVRQCILKDLSAH